MFLRFGLVIAILLASSHPSLAQEEVLDASPGEFLHAVLTVECFHATPVKYSDGSIENKPGKAYSQIRIGFKHMAWGSDGKLKSASGIEPKVTVLMASEMDVVSDLQKPLLKDGVLVLTLKQIGEIHLILTPDQQGTLAKGEGCKFIPLTPISFGSSSKRPN